MYTNNVRFLSFLLAAVLMITAVFSTATFPALTGVAENALSSVRGDVDGDGQLMTTDARAVLLYLLGGVDFDEQQILRADVNSDGRISTADARQILLILAQGTTTPTGEIDLLVYSNIISTENAAVTEQADGSWLISSTAAGQVTVSGPGIYDASVLQWTHLSVSSTVPSPRMVMSRSTLPSTSTIWMVPLDSSTFWVPGVTSTSSMVPSTPRLRWLLS